MSDLALITGASSGIGEELARVHAEKGGDLVIVARRKDRLEELAAELEKAHGVSVHVLAADLSRTNAVKQLVSELGERSLEIDMLINNAGYGAYGNYHESDWASEHGMMQVNMIALSELTHRLVPHMVERGHGRVLNVGSIAGFLPGPTQAVYFASKAYVNSLSQALAEELRGTGVTVTVLCPGPVATEFQETSDMEHVRGFELAASARSVAERGYRGMERGELLVFNEKKLRVLMDGLLPFMPRRGLLWASRKGMERS